MKRKKLGLISSSGGHLFQLYQLKPLWSKYDRFWVTFSGSSTDSILKGEDIHFGFYPESRNILNAIRNTFLALFVLTKEKPDVLISFGAGIAPPFFYIGKLLGMKLVFIEPYDFINEPSLTARFVEPLADLFLVQNENQLSFFKKAKYWGATM